MTLVGPTETRRIMEECFSGETTRDCKNCPASHDYGGKCCFGRISKYDAEDEECKACIHSEDCPNEIFNTEAEAQHFEETYGHRPPAEAPTPPRTRLHVIQPSAHQRPSQPETLRPLLIKEQIVTPRRYYASTPKEEIVAQEPPKKLARRFFLDIMWGAFQGVFEMGLTFFRSNRIP